ncbi:MAG: hypothetical protein JEY91_08655 [Spirochaetaceae bacterium]|nr:hypothetical protein [Spirochaetaceae bacterium]
MTGFGCITEDISNDVLILPGFQEGLSRRGSWFACTVESKEFIKQFHRSKKYILRYEVHEPDSEVPLSEGELFHLVNTITFSFDQYKNLLGRMEMQYKDIRKRGKLNAFIYILGILTVRWYWWIFLTRGEMSLYNQQNAIKFKKIVKMDNIISRIWTRGVNSDLKKALNETCRFYHSLQGDGLEKYREMIKWAKDQSERSPEYVKIEKAYESILTKLTGRSLYTKMLPTNLFQRILFFFNKSLSLPLPENVYAIRNLSACIETGSPRLPSENSSYCENNRVEGNIIELYLLASKKGDPVCIADREPLQLAGTLTRSGNMARADRELKIILHTGTDSEKESLLKGENRKILQARILNAALDTIRQGESMLCYYMKEILPVYYRQIRAMYPFRSRLHSLFPWLFITNGIPVASVLAVVWLFIDPYYEGKFMQNYNRYYNRILETLDLSYHNLSIEVKSDFALGQVNQMIRNNKINRGFRDSMNSINQFALPVSIMDRVLFNNLTMETDQLKDSMREANSFTTIPIKLLGEDKSHG